MWDPACITLGDTKLQNYPKLAKHPPSAGFLSPSRGAVPPAAPPGLNGGINECRSELSLKPIHGKMSLEIVNLPGMGSALKSGCFFFFFLTISERIFNNQRNGFNNGLSLKKTVSQMDSS